MGSNRRWIEKVRSLPLREKLALLFVAGILCMCIAHLLLNGSGKQSPSLVTTNAYANIGTQAPEYTPMYSTTNPDYTGDYPLRYSIQYVH